MSNLSSDANEEIQVVPLVVVFFASGWDIISIAEVEVLLSVEEIMPRNLDAKADFHRSPEALVEVFHPLWPLNSWRSSGPSMVLPIEWNLYPPTITKCILTVLGTVLFLLVLSPLVTHSLFPFSESILPPLSGLSCSARSFRLQGD